VSEVRGHHEEFSRHAEIRGSSARSFGLVCAIFFGLIGCLPLRQGAPVRLWAIVLSAGFLTIALARPSLLGPLNHLWFKLGLLLSHIVNPVVMALLFYAVITPFAFIFRLLGKDPLHLRWDRACDSYWISRRPPGPSPDSMSNQF
jgi:hypothetical protein